MELLVKPLIQAHGAHALHVAGTNSESKAVQGVHDPLIVFQLRGLTFSLFVFSAQQEGDKEN
jgi:hypothetical protein